MTTPESKNYAIYCYDLLRSLGFNDLIAKYAVAQFAHETNGFTSIIFRLNNNVCGMTYAQQAIAVDEKNGYANYKSLDDSIIDYYKWYIKRRNNILSLPLVITSLSDFVNFLKKQSYFTDTEKNYLSGVTYFYSKIYG